MSGLGDIFQRRYERRTEPDLAVLGVLAGIGIGVAGTTAIFIVLVLTQARVPTEFQGAGLMVFFVAPVAFVGWLAGMLVIGVPGLAVLHLVGARWPAATALYGGLAVATVLLPLWTTEEPTAWLTALGMAFSGAVAGWTINRVAYRAPPRPAVTAVFE